MNVICQTLSEKSKSRSELKREAIIDAARKAFKEYGVDATSMDKLAEIAQVSK
ncbi:TetR/AcrR family transcriptional regulator, partial [Oleiphilus sp. HI0043]